MPTEETVTKEELNTSFYDKKIVRLDSEMIYAKHRKYTRISPLFIKSYYDKLGAKALKAYLKTLKGIQLHVLTKDLGIKNSTGRKTNTEFIYAILKEVGVYEDRATVRNENQEALKKQLQLIDLQPK